ncbi:hypothetical protein C0Q70_16184 [Pomacea canaliculata]|uniref:Uncharacterized protein n=1 Tax=Pomacea canaliculata TaxID=400727 RepID=A0A2T7NP32_POMCA|nr:hypothetical protein C0Q70_16184 [Pomacea canaliculata]
MAEGSEQVIATHLGVDELQVPSAWQVALFAAFKTETFVAGEADYVVEGEDFLHAMRADAPLNNPARRLRVSPSNVAKVACVADERRKHSSVRQIRDGVGENWWEPTRDGRALGVVSRPCTVSLALAHVVPHYFVAFLALVKYFILEAPPVAHDPPVQHGPKLGAEHTFAGGRAGAPHEVGQARRHGDPKGSVAFIAEELDRAPDAVVSAQDEPIFDGCRRWTDRAHTLWGRP